MVARIGSTEDEIVTNQLQFQTQQLIESVFAIMVVVMRVGGVMRKSERHDEATTA